MKQYRVYIDDDYSNGDYMVCMANNEREARAEGELYIKRWQLCNAHIVEIVEHID